jgi:hypothetical protein
MRPALHYLGVACLALLVGLLFLQEPGFGDDLTYWKQAFDTHEQGLRSIERGSFHDLRWPVWGVCWAIQAVAGFGLESFYGEPLFYLALGALLAFALGQKLLGSPAAGWAGAVAFLFQPLLDSVCFRPMPDLSEGVLGAAILASWWALMRTLLGARAVLWTVVTGVLVYVAQANRVTGAFIALVLIVNTLVLFRARFFWLVAAGLVALVCYAGEAWFYHGRFGDWLHAIHANMGNAENKGTEPIPLWYLPFRFFDTLWKGNPLAPVYCVLAVFGLASCWRKLGELGRVIALWFVVLFLCYSCAPQPVWPIRPLIRDADRFLAGLAVPISLLAVAGLWWLGRALRPWRPAWTERVPRPVFAVAAVALLALGTSRERFSLGFVPEFSAYMRALPEGTKVFTHESMRAIAFLCDENAARRLLFNAPNRILLRTPELEAQAAECAEFWYARKLVWLSTRKQLERRALAEMPPLGSYFDTPERDWTLVRLLAKGDTPDLIFYRRRTPADAVPRVLMPEAPEWRDLLPTLPVEWVRGKSDPQAVVRFRLPESLRGKLVRLELVAASEPVEAVTLRLKFKHEGSEVAEYLLKPYLHPRGSKEFFVFPIPASADHCDATLKFTAKAATVHFTALRLVVEEPR